MREGLRVFLAAQGWWSNQKVWAARAQGKGAFCNPGGGGLLFFSQARNGQMRRRWANQGGGVVVLCDRNELLHFFCYTSQGVCVKEVVLGRQGRQFFATKTEYLAHLAHFSKL